MPHEGSALGDHAAPTISIWTKAQLTSYFRLMHAAAPATTTRGDFGKEKTG